MRITTSKASRGREGGARGFSRRARLTSLAAAGLTISLSTALVGSPASGATRDAADTPALGMSPCCSWGTSWSYNVYSPIALGIGDGYVFQRLAEEDYPSLTQFTPQLATSWKVSGNTLTLHLRTGVNWQNGQPFTSKDVYDTILLDGTNETAFWDDVAGVAAPNSSTVVITLRPGTSPVLFEDALFTLTFIYPSSVYGSVITPNLESQEVAYYKVYATNVAAADKMPQYKAISAVFNKLVALPVSLSDYIGTGPFRLTAINTSVAKMVKWDGFYGASKVHVPAMTYYNNPNEAIYPQLFSGAADFSNVYMPTPILDRWLHTPGANMALTKAFGFQMEFNDAKYPLNLTKVRQALAYVIPRNLMVDAAYGTSPYAGGTVATPPDGLPGYNNAQYLTPKQVASLNPYNVNPAKATALLDSVGFKKKGGTWYTPKGAKFTLTLYANSATSDIVTSFTSAAKALTAFGIPSSVVAEQGAVLAEQEGKGDFQVAAELNGSVNPLENFEYMLGPGNNYPTLGNYAGDRSMGFGPVVDVPGLGKVNVSATIAKEYETVGPGPEMNALTWDWARLVDQQVPYLWYATKVYQFPFSTAHYTDYPPLNSQHTSALWNIIGEDMGPGIALAMEEGYIRPKA